MPGAAHLFVFWAFVILASVYLEAYGVLLLSEDFAIPLIGHWEVLGFAQDLIAVLALVSLGVFAQIRLKNAPEKLGRRSRFSGSHLGGAWLVLFMIFNVIWTMFLFRGAASALGNLPYDSGAFVSVALGNLLDGLSDDALHLLEGIGLLLHIGVMLVFLVIVLNSKHLHIFVAPLNVMFKRQPVALGAARPLSSAGKPVTLDDLEEMDEDTRLGIGSIEDFSWKGLLDMATCTECGRCQDQCPAWNTEKPLSPKMLIMNMRDHAFHIGSYLQADQAKRDTMLEADPELAAEVERALVGATEGEAWHPTGGGVIDPDVLWSCVTCGACVQQCPVDIEHVDHIVDMRRHQVLVESTFPAELNQLFKGMESKGNPWNLSPNMRMDWAQGLDFEVPVVGEDLESLESVDWLFWVGCAGAYEDRAKKTTRAVAELLDIAGHLLRRARQGRDVHRRLRPSRRQRVRLPGPGPAERRDVQGVQGQEGRLDLRPLLQHPQERVPGVRHRAGGGPPHPAAEPARPRGQAHPGQGRRRARPSGRSPTTTRATSAVTTRCTTPPRELLQVLPGAEFVEMERNSERSFCCGAGGARMWMEETIGERINLNRTTEAVGTGADQIAVGCPFCRVMLSDGLTAMQDSGDAREEVEVLDVAQMLLASVKGEPATRQKKAAAGASAKAGPSGSDAAAGGTATATLTRDDDATQAEPEAGDATQTEGTITETADAGPAAKASGGSSLFDLGDDDAGSEPEPADAGAGAGETAAPAAAGGSLFDLGGDEPASEQEDAGPEETAAPAAPGGSLFDLGADEPAQPTPEKEPEPDLGSGSLFDVSTPAEPEPTTAPEPERAAEAEVATPPAAPKPTAAPTSEIPEGGSLFDISAPAEPEPAAEPAAEAPALEPESEAQDTTAVADEPAEAAKPAVVSTSEIPEGGSLFDIAAPAQTAAAPTQQPEPEQAEARGHRDGGRARSRRGERRGDGSCLRRRREPGADASSDESRGRRAGRRQRRRGADRHGRDQPSRRSRRRRPGSRTSRRPTSTSTRAARSSTSEGRGDAPTVRP